MQVNKKAQEQNKQVNHADDAEHHEYRYDAKEKGNGSYQDNRRRNKKEDKKEDGTFSRKKTSGFDIRI